MVRDWFVKDSELLGPARTQGTGHESEDDRLIEQTFQPMKFITMFSWNIRHWSLQSHDTCDTVTFGAVPRR